MMWKTFKSLVDGNIESLKVNNLRDNNQTNLDAISTLLRNLILTSPL